jgi:hypothetical protein
LLVFGVIGIAIYLMFIQKNNILQRQKAYKWYFAVYINLSY